jgi:hypothetical protein
VRQQCRHVLLEPISEKQRRAVWGQHLGHLMDDALRHGQRPVTDVNHQHQFALRIDRAPDPSGRAGQTLNRLGFTDLARLDLAEQGKEFVQLHLRDPHVVEEMVGKRRGMVRDFDQPPQHGIGIDRKDSGDGPNTQPFS